ncbi:MAG: pimeloyl-CoA dehydrogenase large subunit [Betaproteobacteria bacterium]|nr:MAG: pimeloyl-CoA dehydrogenase large subunit [Betaproteobacteria bacterium]
MDLRLTQEELAFRDEVRAFFRQALPAPIRRKMELGQRQSKEDIVTWQRILNAKGWAVPHWPVEWGGTGWSPVQNYIFKEEMQLAPAPDPLGFNVSMVGPVIIAFGNEAQKRHFLPKVANLDYWFCQGFSEPGAGSDLASLRTSARREGDHYVVNGQKIWTSRAHNADWMFCLVRTDSAVKPQLGISYLLIDMRTPGLTVRPIPTIDGEHHFNEVFFDDVRVPVENLVGEENKGWTYAKYLLGNERTGIARVGASKYRIHKAKQLAASVMIGDTPLAETERFREKLAAIEVELKALEITQMRVVFNASRLPRGVQDPASSVLKLKGTELQQAATEILMEVAGAYAMAQQSEHLWGTATDEPVGPEWAATVAPDYFYTRAASIYGGSNEIQKNVIAKRLLGL